MLRLTRVLNNYKCSDIKSIRNDILDIKNDIREIRNKVVVIEYNVGVIKKHIKTPNNIDTDYIKDRLDKITTMLNREHIFKIDLTDPIN